MLKLFRLILQDSQNLNIAYQMVSKRYRIKMHSSSAIFSAPKSFKRLSTKLKVKMNPKKVNEKPSSDRLYQFSCLYNQTESEQGSGLHTSYSLVYACEVGQSPRFLKSSEK